MDSSQRELSSPVKQRADRYMSPKENYDIVLSLADPYFWGKVKSVDDRAVNGTVYLHPKSSYISRFSPRKDVTPIKGEDKLPFSLTSLLYYLLFSPIVKEIKEQDIPDAQTLRFDRLEDNDAFFIVTNGGSRRGHVIIPQDILSQIVAAENERRPHDVMLLLNEFIQGNFALEFLVRDMVISRGITPQAPGHKQEIIKLPQTLLEIDIDWVERRAFGVAEVALFSSSQRDIQFATNKLKEDFGERHFYIYKSNKFVLYDFQIIPKSIEEFSELHHHRITIFPENYTHVLSLQVNCKVVTVDLAYWEMYVEPWLHLPHLLLNRPNPKMATEILAYWSNLTGFNLKLETLEKVIIGWILADKWDDTVWIGAHLLLTN